MDYSQLSDFEINKRVSKIIYSVSFVNPHSKTVSVNGGKRLFDPCNSPADAWPIIVENKIKIEPVRRVRNYNEWYEEWDASVNSPHFCESHKNPLRAAMLVFLLSQDNDHA